MEKMLQRMASQLGAYDESSLLSLWDKYYQEVRSFQPTKQWEDSVLILCLLQAVRWKNQLFNSKWMEQRTTASEPLRERDQDGVNGPQGSATEDPRENGSCSRGKVLDFPTKEDDTH